jgi:hypothetical protein
MNTEFLFPKAQTNNHYYRHNFLNISFSASGFKCDLDALVKLVEILESFQGVVALLCCGLAGYTDWHEPITRRSFAVAVHLLK